MVLGCLLYVFDLLSSCYYHKVVYWLGMHSEYCSVDILIIEWVWTGFTYTVKKQLFSSYQTRMHVQQHHAFLPFSLLVLRVQFQT